MKKISSILTIFAIIPILAAAKTTKAFTVTTVNGQRQSIVLSDYPIITMDDGNLTIKTKDADYQFDLQKVDLILYEDIEISSNSPAIDKADNSFRQNGNLLYFKTGSSPMSISIASTNGIIMHNAFINAEATYTLSIQDYPQGVYLATVNSVTYKIIKR